MKSVTVLSPVNTYFSSSRGIVAVTLYSRSEDMFLRFTLDTHMNPSQLDLLTPDRVSLSMLNRDFGSFNICVVRFKN